MQPTEPVADTEVASPSWAKRHEAALIVGGVATVALAVLLWAMLARKTKSSIRTGDDSPTGSDRSGSAAGARVSPSGASAKTRNPKSPPFAPGATRASKPGRSDSEFEARFSPVSEKHASPDASANDRRSGSPPRTWKYSSDPVIEKIWVDHFEWKKDFDARNARWREDFDARRAEFDADNKRWWQQFEKDKRDWDEWFRGEQARNTQSGPTFSNTWHVPPRPHPESARADGTQRPAPASAPEQPRPESASAARQTAHRVANEFAKRGIPAAFASPQSLYEALCQLTVIAREAADDSTQTIFRGQAASLLHAFADHAFKHGFPEIPGTQKIPNLQVKRTILPFLKGSASDFTQVAGAGLSHLRSAIWKRCRNVDSPLTRELDASDKRHSLPRPTLAAR